MYANIEQIQASVEKESALITRLTQQVSSVIVGQKYLIDRLMIGMLANGHLLIEGVPGLAKTLSVKTLSDAIQAKFQRLQFTPDLLPADLIGTLVYNPQTAQFTVKKGPVFANIILADEINRAPAKVQSALLEAMQERQVTIGDTTYKLEDPFLVLATQNPIEQEGTYPLPEAQVDRFIMMLKISYPTPAEEREILNRNTTNETVRVEKVVTPAEIISAQKLVRTLYIDEKVKEYIINIVFATREPEKYGLAKIKSLIGYGASPRATIFLTLAAKAHAFLKGRGYVTPEDVKAIGADVLRHRVILTYEAEAEEVSADKVVQHVFDAVEVP